mgnify:CR=1 FL=1
MIADLFLHNSLYIGGITSAFGLPDDVSRGRSIDKSSIVAIQKDSIGFAIDQLVLRGLFSDQQVFVVLRALGGVDRVDSGAAAGRLDRTQGSWGCNRGQGSGKAGVAAGNLVVFDCLPTDGALKHFLCVSLIVPASASVQEQINLFQEFCMVIFSVEKSVIFQLIAKIWVQAPMKALPVSEEGPMGEDLIDVGSAGRVELEEFPEQVLGVSGESLGNRGVLRLELAAEVGEPGDLEGRLAREQLHEEDAEAPDVRFRTVAAGENDLGGHVLVGPADRGLELQRLRQQRRPAEVADLRLEVLAQQHVLGLQVPVDDPPVVEVLETPGHLVEKPQGEGLFESPRRVDVEEERAPRRPLEEDVDGFIHLEGIDVLDDIGVGQFRVEGDFGVEVLAIGLAQLGQRDLMS